MAVRDMLLFDKKNGLRIKEYYQLKVYPLNLTYKETVVKVRELLDKAIQRQMISDVGISCFLSGGLDSSIISTVASKYIQTQKVMLFEHSILYDEFIRP